jgi:hypothetical protein
MGPSLTVILPIPLVLNPFASGSCVPLDRRLTSARSSSKTAATKKRGPLGSPARLLASEGNKRLDRWINRHGRCSCLLLEQHLRR